jgi:hypothetical protein
MAIYSCNLRSIGRTTHDAGTAGAHIRYISRPDAEPQIVAQHMPDEVREARTWMDNRERALRKNARVIDKLRIALPRELDEKQRTALVRAFMAELTDGRIPWYAAIHQKGKDAHNPHVHIAIHDRDIESRKRVLRLSDSARDRIAAGLPGPKAVEWIRQRWEIACNDALERAGKKVRIDRRTLEAQGIDRAPTIHEGPRAQHIDDNVGRPRSRRRTNGCGRVIDYPSIDNGRTRREFNAHIIDLNLERAARSKNPVTAVWAQFEKDQRKKDQELEKRLAAERRQRTAEYRNASLLYLARINRMRAERNLKVRAAERRVREKFDTARGTLRKRHEQERQALKDKQSRLHIRIFALLDITGTTRRRHEAARKALSKTHKEERKAISDTYKTAKKAAKDATRDRYKKEIADQHVKRARHLAQIRDKNERADDFADIDRQQRELDREHTRRITEAKLDNWKEQGKEGGKDGGTKTGTHDFARAIVRAAKQEAGRPKEPGKGLERDGPD